MLLSELAVQFQARETRRSSASFKRGPPAMFGLALALAAGAQPRSASALGLPLPALPRRARAPRAAPLRARAPSPGQWSRPRALLRPRPAVPDAAAAAGAAERELFGRETRALAEARVRRTTAVLVVPALVAGAVGFAAFGPIALTFRNFVGLESLTSLSNDQGQFIQNFLSVIGILFSLLIGNTYYFCYNQQVQIFMAFFEEVSVAKALLEQTTLVCQGRPHYAAVLDHIDRYVERDLRRVDLACVPSFVGGPPFLWTPPGQTDRPTDRPTRRPAVVLSSKPRDDPLEAVMWMTSVGTPSVIYDTVKWLRQARGARLGAMQRKLPPLHFALLFLLGALEIVAFPLLSAGAAETVTRPPLPWRGRHPKEERKKETSPAASRRAARQRRTSRRGRPVRPNGRQHHAHARRRRPALETLGLGLLRRRRALPDARRPPPGPRREAGADQRPLSRTRTLPTSLLSRPSRERARQRPARSRPHRGTLVDG